MNQFLSLPDWAPAWLGPVLVILGALFALAFLLMPFTVFSLKSRLDQIEEKLDELLSALHAVSPAPPPLTRYDAPVPQRPASYAPPVPAPQPSAAYPVKPPLAPRGVDAPREERVRDERPLPEPRRPDFGRVDPVEPRFNDAPRAPSRNEPKFNWPR